VHKLSTANLQVYSMADEEMNQARFFAVGLNESGKIAALL
jgi:hypothetical protein